MEKIERAAALIEAKASEYEPKAGLFYPVFFDRQGDQLEEVQADEQDNICYDCYEKALMYFRARRKAGLYKDDCDGQVAGVGLWRESSPEKEDFTLCGFCFEHIETSRLFRSEQEPDHWLSLSDEQFGGDLTNVKCCWELHTMLTDADAQEHIPKALELVANRIISLHPL